MNSVYTIIKRTRKFENEFHSIFSSSERSKSRVFVVSDSYSLADSLNVKQGDLIKQALKCCEFEIFRAAHVLAWAAIIDYLQEWLAEDGFKKINCARPKWLIKSLEQLREDYTEYAQIEALHAMAYIKKTEMKAFHGLLSKRNECAHPSEYYPQINETLGYISEIMTRIDTINTRRNS